MNMLVGSLTFLPLFTVAFAHYLWAFGNTWPIRNETLLAQTVVGRTGITKMPNRFLTFIIATGILVLGITALSLADPVAGGLGFTLLGVLLALAFIARGVLGYTPAWRARFGAEPFATLDRRNYSPLCFWIGAGFLILALMRVL